MYIVDFLAFVIVAAPYGTYSSTDTGAPKGALHIISIVDPADPKIVKSVALSGYPLDSRRVGEVIYVVSNLYGYYGVPFPVRGGMIEGDIAVADGSDGSSKDETTKDLTEIVSISFSDPETIGEKDRTSFTGTSSNICVSDTAIFVSRYDYSDWSAPRTGITYVDISDPSGEISIRDSIAIDGWLADRYQMDHFGDHFRIVTQQWGESLAESTLYVISTSDPDSLKVVGKLVIDDAGSLMATRFAGDRGYTIHLPRSIDPLDVLDLSDPEDPKLCDVLEMPGWVEHMEVVGYSIIAIGVDDTKGTWQVALSLFDVSDPYDAVMQDRVIMGEGWSYSPANYDPKALTIDSERGMVLIPYYSYDYYSYVGINMIQIVSVDLDDGDLALRGAIRMDSSPTRTRVVGNSVLATSELELVSADVTDPDAPVIDSVLALTSQYSDALMSEGRIVAAVSPAYGNDEAFIRVLDPSDQFSPVAEIGVDGLRYQDARIVGDLAFIKGLRIGTDSVNWEIHSFDISNPSKISEKGNVSIPITDMFVWSRELPSDGTGSEKEVRADPSEGRIAVYYDPMQYSILKDGTAVVWTYSGIYYAYDMYSEKTTLKAWVIDWAGETDVHNVDLVSWYYIDKVLGNRDSILLSTVVWDYENGYYGYNTQGSAIAVLERSEGGYDRADHKVLGSLIGASSDLSFVYSIHNWYDEKSGSSGNALLTYSLDGSSMELVDSSTLPGYYGNPLFINDDVIILSEGYYYGYYGYYGGAVDDAVGSSEKAASPSEGSDSKVAPDEYKPQTKIHVVRLSDGIPESIRTVTMDGYLYKVPVDGGLFLQGDDVLTGFSVEGPSIQRIGSWAINGYVVGGEYSEGSLVLAKGLWGIEQIQ
jgi:hypothetical protein